MPPATRLWTPASVLATLGLAAATLGTTLLLPSTPVRISLLLLALAALVLPRLPSGGRLSEVARTRLLVALAVAALAHGAGPDLWRFTTSPWVRVWPVFHYYLGAEYFDELGYHDLYVAALAADHEAGGYWNGVERVRNLETYEVGPRAAAEARYRPADHFSPERWQDFKDDLAALQPQMSPREWRGVMRDRGYNPSPFWTVSASWLTRWLPASSPAALKLLTGLDLLLFVLTFWLIGRTFGARTTALVLLFLALSPVNLQRLLGGFLQYDWFCAIAAGVCFVKRRQPLPAAAALAFATMARVFPLLLVASALAPAALRWVRTGRLDRVALRFTAAFALFCLAGLGIGSLGGHGFRAWEDFGRRITHHSELHVFGEQRVGLKHWFTHEVTSLDLDRSGDERRETFARQEPLYRAAAVIFLLGYVLVLGRRKGVDALLFGLVPLFALVVASRYYWACLALLPCLAAPGPEGTRRARLLAVSQAVLYGLYYVFFLFQSGRYESYSVFNGLLAVLLVVWLGLYLRRDVAVWRRTRRRAASAALTPA